MSTRESTFSSFLVFDGNRRAHDLCLAISRGDPVSPLPLVLLGERGSGKSHLLRAVAQRLRASAGHAAIVLISPQSKPEEIARLADDPEPIDMARLAVLLIDDFPAFTADLDKLAQLIRIFLENDHPVILASEVHPDRMGKLPTALQRIVRGGQVVPVDGGEAAAAIKVVEAGVREAERETVARLEQRILELESAGPDGAALEHARRVAALDELHRDLAEARQEIEHLRGENALLSVSAREAKALRRKLDELERERVEHASRPAEETPVQSDEIKRNLDEARYDAQKAREEARAMLERAQHLLAELHKSRETFQEARREHERQRDDIRRFQSGLPADSADSGGVDVEPIAQGVDDTDMAGSSTAANTVDEELAAAREELQRLQESLVRARAERDNAKSHLTHIRHELDTAAGDLERLRTDAAEDAAAHQARVSDLETALLARQAEIDQLHELQRAFTEEIRSLQSQVTEGADVLERLMELFGREAPQDDEVNAEAPDEANAADDAVSRADFGEGIRLVPRRPSLHHIEEVRGHATTFFPPNLPPLEDGGENDFEGKAASA